MIKKFFPERDFKAFLFDFDGTVADTMPIHLAAWNHALGIFGLTLTLEQHNTWAGRPNNEVVRLLNEFHKTNLSEDVIKKHKEEYYLKTGATAKEIVPVMDIVRASFGKIPMAIVSGSARRAVQSTMDHLGIAKYFDLLVCAEDYTLGKPAPDCFLKAAAQLGVAPADCLVFEDANLGIQAAHAAGMKCLRVSEDHQLSVV